MGLDEDAEQRRIDADKREKFCAVLAKMSLSAVMWNWKP